MKYLDRLLATPEPAESRRVAVPEVSRAHRMDLLTLERFLGPAEPRKPESGHATHSTGSSAPGWTASLTPQILVMVREQVVVRKNPDTGRDQVLALIDILTPEEFVTGLGFKWPGETIV
jgi:hypothetical protein